MKPFTAIVLTCDRHRALTDHMVYRYGKLWPHHPFRFRVPYQELGPTAAADNVEYRKSPLAIKSTVLTLLDGLDDEKLVYWCIDDKYPVELNVPRADEICKWLSGKDADEISGALFCRCRKMWDDDFLTGQTVIDTAGNLHLERNSYRQIWIHQFLRVKVLRHLFESFPDVIPEAKAMDKYLEHTAKPLTHRIFVSNQSLAVFGESTSRGILTRNCLRSMQESGLTPPAWHAETTGQDNIMGSPLRMSSTSIAHRQDAKP